MVQIFISCCHVFLTLCRENPMSKKNPSISLPPNVKIKNLPVSAKGAECWFWNWRTAMSWPPSNTPSLWVALQHSTLQQPGQAWHFRRKEKNICDGTILIVDNTKTQMFGIVFERNCISPMPRCANVWRTWGEVMQKKRLVTNGSSSMTDFGLFLSVSTRKNLFRALLTSFCRTFRCYNLCWGMRATLTWRSAEKHETLLYLDLPTWC